MDAASAMPARIEFAKLMIPLGTTKACVPHLCKFTEERKGASRPADRGTAPKRQSLQGDTERGKARAGGKSAEVIRLTSSDGANGKKSVTHRGCDADNCKHLAIYKKAEALERLKTMNGTTVA